MRRTDRDDEDAHRDPGGLEICDRRGEDRDLLTLGADRDRAIVAAAGARTDAHWQLARVLSGMPPDQHASTLSRDRICP